MGKSRIVIVLISILTAAVLLLPFPQLISWSLTGVIFPVDGQGEAEACTVTLEGTCFRYLLREDEYSGQFAISTLVYTHDNTDLRTCGENDRVNFLPYLTKQGYRNAGYFVTPDGFHTLYARVEGMDGREYHIVAPADDVAEAEAYIQQMEASREFPLPS